MGYRKMEERDLQQLIPLYMAWYNEREGGQWTYQTTYRRIHQVLSREDSYCLLLEEEEKPLAFAMGYFEQFDDGFVYDLVEIVVAAEYQNQGLGTAFMQELEARVKAEGAIVMILEAVNDAFHDHFYGKLGFQNANNLVIKTKTLK